MNELLALYEKWCGASPSKVEKLPQAGSNRQYIRLFDSKGKSVIGVIGTSVPENACFVYLSDHFFEKGLPVPQVYIVSDDKSCYLQQDLGSTSLYSQLVEARQNGYKYGEAEIALLTKTIRLLPHIQIEGAEQLDFSKCLNPICFNRQAAMFDLNYFKYSFLKTTDIPFDEVLLENDLQQLAADLVGESSEEQFFLYRDYQARNIMIKNDIPYVIDFQGGMKGPLQYDLVSFLWQASARYPQSLRQSLISKYVEELHLILGDFEEVQFYRRLNIFILFRMMQVLGAYGLRGFVEHKKYFLDSIPLALENLREQLNAGSASPYPYLEEILFKLTELPQFNKKVNISSSQAGQSPTSETRSPLIVTIYSFSYKKGIPEDTSGNGGGYVFDCRSTHNPGRYTPYKQLTGLDTPVIKFLEEDGEILTFLKSVYQLADTHVSRYIERGFTHLMFSFGCTGGQHRSVYSAQHLAEHIHQKFGIEVQLCHREQNIHQILK